MKKQITIILFLITLSVAGIFSFQLFWVINSFKVNQEQLLKEVDQALERSVQTEMNMRYSKMAEFVFNADDVTVLTDHQAMNNGIDLDSLLETTMASAKTEDIGMSITLNPNMGDTSQTMDDVPEFMALNLRNILKSILADEIQGSSKLNMVVLDSVLQKEFKERKIDSDYFIDLLNEEKDSVIERSQKINTPERSILFSREIPVSILKNLNVRVGFPRQKQMILARMTGILLISLALLIIVLACFIYMLKTILNQKKLSDIKNDFINNMTHELKTPIATVSAAVEAMQNFNVLDNKDKTDRYLSVSSNELHRLSGLVEKVLNIAAYENKELSLNPENIDLNELINNIIGNQAIKNSQKKVDIVFHSPKKPVIIDADRVHITNVINNLIDNAIKYSNEEVNIDISVNAFNNKTVLHIKDNGIGIARHHQHKIFDKFYRVPTGNIHNVKGFGLGLHYVKNIIEKHEGSISLKSTAGKGSEFIITLNK